MQSDDLKLKCSPDRPKALCVLGMHRSGTSMVSRVVNLLGAYLGEPGDLYGPRHDNPEGFWERKDVVDLHDRLLVELSQKWDSPLPLEAQWIQSASIADCRERLKEIIINSFDGKAIWAWKDPRTCLFLPLWKDVLAELGTDLVVIYVLRNPVDVAWSLARRDGFSVDKSLGIWQNYSLSALTALEGTPMVVLSYDRLLDEPEQQIRRLSAQVGIPYPEGNKTLEEELKTFLRQDLRHSHTLVDNVQVGGQPICELYDMLESQAADHDEMDDNFFQKVQDMYRHYQEGVEMFRWDMENHFRNEGVLIPQLKTDLENLNSKYDVASQRLDERDRQVAERDQRLAERDQRLAERDRQMAERDRQVAERDRQVAQREQQLGERDQRLAERDRQMAERDRQVAERDRQVAQRDQRLAERDQRLAERDRQVAERDRQVAERDRQMAQRDQRLAERDRQVAELDRQVADLRSELNNLDQIIHNKEINLTDLSKQNEQLNSQINEIVNSNSWKITRPLRATRDLFRLKKNSTK